MKLRDGIEELRAALQSMGRALKQPRQRDLKIDFQLPPQSAPAEQQPASPPPRPVRPEISKRASAAAPSSALHRRLRHPQVLREAFIVKEILDRPVALRRRRVGNLFSRR